MNMIIKETAAIDAFMEEVKHSPTVRFKLGIPLDSKDEIQDLRTDLLRLQVASGGVNLFTDQKTGQSLDDDALFAPMAGQDWDKTLYIFLYPELTLAALFYTENDLAPGTQSSGFSVYDVKGAWRDLTDDANDMATAAINAIHETVPVGIIGGGFNVSQFQRDRQAKAGLNLDPLLIEAHNKGRAEKIHKQLYDELMDATITEDPIPVRVGRTNWDDSSGNQIVEDITDATGGVRLDTKRVWGTQIEFTLFISGKTETLLGKKFYMDGNLVPQKVMAYLKSPEGQEETKIKQIVVVQEFDDKPFNGNTEDGFIIGIPDNRKVCEMSFSSVISMVPETHFGKLWFGAYQYLLKKLKWRHKTVFRRFSGVR